MLVVNLDFYILYLPKTRTRNKYSKQGKFFKCICVCLSISISISIGLHVYSHHPVLPKLTQVSQSLRSCCKDTFSSKDSPEGTRNGLKHLCQTEFGSILTFCLHKSEPHCLPKFTLPPATLASAAHSPLQMLQEFFKWGEGPEG